jgi:hypothetical protein
MEVSGQLHAPGRFTPRERAPAAHWIGGWVGPKAILDAVVKRKISIPLQESNPRIQIVQPIYFVIDSVRNPLDTPSYVYI